MPEKSKRRKNNKNKRKNKFSRVDANSNNNATNNVSDLLSPENIKEEKESDSKIIENKCTVEKNLLQNASIENDKDTKNKDENVTDSETDKIKTNKFLENVSTPVDTSTGEPLNVYIVEAPGQSYKAKSKLSNGKKSKSVDDDESLRIIEITEENSLLPNHDNVMNVTNSVLISEIDSDTKWESIDLEENALPKVQELVRGTLSVQTIPLTRANCEKAKLLSSEEELSLRRYLQSLNLTTNPSTSLEIKTEIEQIINSEIKHRLRKKGSAEDGFSQRVGAPRTLDVIDEEASGESSIHSRRHSYLSDKKSENDDLEDDVFEQSCSRTTTNTSYNTQDKVLRKISSREQIPQKCVLVGAKLKDPEISEARGDWSIQTVEKMAGAEVVYLTDSSSSTSSLYDVCEDTGNEQDADVTIRIITPTIEVTDTENLLKKTFIPDNEVINNTRTVKCNTVTDFSSENFEESSSNNYDSNNTFSNTEATLHEVVVLTTDNIKTNLIVKDIDGNKMTSDGTKVDDNLPYDTHVLSEINENKPSRSQYANDYDLEMKVLKCELNDAINNLIREVSDSENVNEISKETFVRRDSSSSISSSQCTAIYNPNSSLIDISHNDDLSQFGNNSKEILSSLEASSHVNDVIESVIKNSFTNESNLYNEIKQPQKLRDMCVQRISTFPYGEKILEELANVSLRLQNMNTFEFDSKEELKHGKIKRKDIMQNTSDQLKISYYRKPNSTENLEQRKSEESCNITKVSPPIPPPPPVPRNSSLKKSKDVNTNFDTSTEEKPYVCLSPSQKMLMEKTKTVFNKEDVTQTELSKKNYNFLKSVQPEKNTLKSETGSRLMALICNPTFTSNINSSLSKLSDEKLLSKNKTEIKPFNSSVKYNDPLLKRSSNSLKPVPPPRPTKLWSSFYESNENSDFHENSFKSLKKEKKTFHFSTGNLSKEIEDDITNIQNMHRNYIKVRNQTDDLNRPRRPSLPKDLCDQQMEYIRKKEKEVEAEIWRLERENSRAPIRKGPRAPMIKETDTINETVDITNQKSSKGMLWNTLLGGKSKKEQNSSIFSSSQEELLREKMYSEYLNEIAEREQRKYHKVIKITNTSLPSNSKFISKSMSALDILDSKVNNRIEEEFISKAKERWNKLGITDPESEDESKKKIYIYKEPKTIEHKIKVIEAGEEKDVHRLPNHLQEFVSFTAKDKQEESGYTETVMIAPTFKARSTSPAVWRPGAPPAPGGSPSAAPSPSAPPPPPPPPIWTPNASPQAPRKTFRPVHFEDTPPTHNKFANAEQNGCMSGSETEGRLRTSQSAPATGLSALGGTITSRLPKAQNPTVTLLQKARENQTSYSSNIHEKDPRLPRDRPSPPLGDPVHALRKGYLSEGEGDRREHVHGGNHKMDDVNRKVEGIGPITKEGMPVALRSEVKDPSRWYKKMYDTIHKNKYDDDYVTIRYKNRQGQPPLRVSSSKSQYAYFDPRSGYLSEPEGGLGRLGSSTWSDAYDSDATAGPRRRTASVQEDRRDEFLSPHLPNNKYSTLASARASQEVYKNQPGRIENYVPGKSSVIDKEAKQWWDEVMDIFDGQNISSTTSLPQTSPKSPKEKKDVTTTILSKSNMARALKESGYESDSTLIFRRREENEAPLSPAERRAAYKDLQAGGEPPLRGFRSPAPPRQVENDSAPVPPRRIPQGSVSDTESPSRRYVESDVNIHYRCPVRHDPLPLVPERELARQQAEHMKRLYRDQKRNKYLQELQDMQNRRHQDNFMPSQKTVIPLNRYDEAEKLVARALYAFNGQTTRELSFKKGDLINVRRQIDSNWYEGEVHGRIGLFPYNYVEILKGDYVHSPKKPVVIEGQARAKFDFTAQTNLELPLKKGEVVILTRRIDHNWWEGRNGVKTGIFPDSYVTVLQEPSQSNAASAQTMSMMEKPAAAPAAHGLVNGAARRGLQRHNYTPQHNSPALSNAPPATAPLPGYIAKPAHSTLTPSERGYGPPSSASSDLNNAEPLYVDTNAEAIPYRAMYKYRPQNPDELELQEGDTVYVLEKCDDGWYVGSSQRTGRFGTFPGNYVERI